MSAMTAAELSPAKHAIKRGEPTWEIAMLFPLQGEWTEAGYWALPTNWRIELSEGCLEVLPVPTKIHQRILLFLLFSLQDYLRTHPIGELLPAPLPVRLWPGKLREPALVFSLFARKDASVKHAEGMDLAMEILSEGEENRDRDLVTKRAEYAKAGVKEYWIVDPEENRITVLTLEADEYRLHGEFGSGTRATSVLLRGFEVDVSAVLAAGEGPKAAEFSSDGQ
jgi:Uma2 family endonuclease